MSAVPNTSHLNFLGVDPKPAAPVYAAADAVASKEPTECHSPTPRSEPSVGESQSQSACTAEISEISHDRKEQKSTIRVQYSSKRKGTVKLHRVAEVRASQGVSERTMCRRLNIDVKQLRAIEDPTYDLSLSELAIIRDALEVPFADLLVENETLSRPVQERAQMLKIMKTAVSIKECKLPPRAARLAQMLCEQMIALMPELAEVGGWPEFGSRRGSDSVARILASEIDTSNIRSE